MPLQTRGDKERSVLAHSPQLKDGQSVTALPAVSDVNLLRDFKRVIDLDTEVTHCALDLRVAEQLGFIRRIS